MIEKSDSAEEKRNNKISSIRNMLKLMPIMRKNMNQIQHKIQRKAKRKQSCSSPHQIFQIQNLQNSDNDQSPLEFKNNFEQKYELLEKIGQGSNGVVKKCFNKLKSKYFAVKIIQMNDQHIQMLKNSFFTIKNLKHQNIIKYKSIYFNSKINKCYLVMQYANMPNLLHNKHLCQQELKYVTQKIIETLAYLHKNGICHRDIKPQNILYDSQSKKLKLIDFGICKSLYKRGRYQQMLTNTGTLFYKSPQMFRGAGYNQKVDTWALGITLYKLITRKTPFESIYLSQTIKNIQTKELQFKDKSFQNYSYLVQSLISRLIRRKRQERLSAQQAKHHLWFKQETLREDSLTRSDSTKFWQSNKNYQNQDEYIQDFSPCKVNMRRKKSFGEQTQPDTGSSYQSKKQIRKKLQYNQNNLTLQQYSSQQQIDINIQ